MMNVQRSTWFPFSAFLPLVTAAVLALGFSPPVFAGVIESGTIQFVDEDGQPTMATMPMLLSNPPEAATISILDPPLVDSSSLTGFAISLFSYTATAMSPADVSWTSSRNFSIVDAPVAAQDFIQGEIPNVLPTAGWGTITISASIFSIDTESTVPGSQVSTDPMSFSVLNTGPFDWNVGLQPPVILSPGDYQLIMAFDLFFTPNAPGDSVTVDPPTYVVNLAAVPEPSSLVLASLGLVALAGVARRRRPRPA